MFLKDQAQLQLLHKKIELEMQQQIIALSSELAKKDSELLKIQNREQPKNANNNLRNESQLCLEREVQNVYAISNGSARILEGMEEEMSIHLSTDLKRELEVSTVIEDKKKEYRRIGKRISSSRIYY